MAIDTEVAESIINEYKSGFDDTTPMPESDEAKIERATYLYEEAWKAFEAGDRDNTIQSIIFIGDSSTVGEQKESDGTSVADTYPRRSSGGLSESDEREIPPIAQEDFENAQVLPGVDNLPIPHAIEGDAEVMPRDLSTTGDKDIRRLSGEYNAYLARATYLLSVEQSSLVQAEHVLNAAKSKAMKALPASDKKRTLKEIDALIFDEPDVKEWTDKVVDHESNIARYKGLKEIYSGNVAVLSREWTMRQNEWEKGR